LSILTRKQEKNMQFSIRSPNTPSNKRPWLRLQHYPII